MANNRLILPIYNEFVQINKNQYFNLKIGKEH